MKIVLECERMKYDHTGLFEYCYQLGHALKNTKSPDDEISYYLHPNLQKHFKGHDNFLNQNSLHKFVFPLYRNIDIWHTTYQMSSYIPRSKNIKRVLTIHDLNFLHENKSTFSIKNYLNKHQKNIDLADHIVAISEFTKQDILANLNVADRPITVIHNGCAEEVYSSDIKPGYVPSKPFLFALGTVNSKKNFHVLAPLLQNNNYELIIAGKADHHYKHKIICEAAKYKVENRIKILGSISTQNKYWYYENCEAFLFPSIAEGFGIPPIEAMRFGKPTFLSDRTSLPEIGGKHAYYFKSFEPADMQSVFKSGMDHFREFKPVGDIIRHAQQFSWKNSAREYLDVYKRTLSEQEK